MIPKDLIKQSPDREGGIIKLRYNSALIFDELCVCDFYYLPSLPEGIKARQLHTLANSRGVERYIPALFILKPVQGGIL